MEERCRVWPDDLDLDVEWEDKEAAVCDKVAVDDEVAVEDEVAVGDKVAVDDKESLDEEGVGAEGIEEELEDKVEPGNILRRRPCKVDLFFRFLEPDAGSSGIKSLSSLTPSSSESSSPV